MLGDEVPRHHAETSGAHDPALTVVVITWNRCEYLADALAALCAQDVPPGGFEIVVVDDGSTDATPQVVEEAAADLPVWYVPIRHGGVNAARNAGIRAAGGRVIAFLDDDELAPPGWVERVLSTLAARPELAGVGGPVRDTPAGEARTCGRCSLAEVRRGDAAQAIRRDLPGGNMAIRREVFDEVGPFDSDLSGRGDEDEWFSRAGRDFLYDEDLFAWHRRDGMSSWSLIALQFRQGRVRPAAYRKMGRSYRPRPGKIVRSLGHGLVRRCTNGFLIAARELGATAGWLRPPPGWWRRA